jgi:protein SCO1/2
MLPRLDKIIWTLLVAAMLAVVIVFAVVDSKPLPVIGEVAPFRLTNQLGAPVSSETLRGQAWAANVIFSRCPTLCVGLSQQMERMQLLLERGASTRLISLTADPEFDTPPTLLAYGRRFEANTNRWWFLTGPKADVYRLATNSLKFTVMENADPANAKIEDLFIHSTAYVVVDKRLRLRLVVQGERPEAEATILEALRRLSREK